MQKNSVADELVSSLEEMTLFVNQTGEPHAFAPVGDAFQVFPIREEDFEHFLISRAHGMLNTIVPMSTIKSVIAHFAAKARLNGQRVALDVRFARRNKTLWLDLLDPNRCAVKITIDGWKIVRLKKIIFCRYRHQLEIPRPRRRGEAQALFDYLNLVNNHQRLLVLAWLCCALVADIPRPILLLTGPQGSAKTTQAKMLRALIDPSGFATNSLSSNPAELAQVLEHNAVPLFDNVSWINQQTTNALCSAVTGGGFSKRALYSNDSDVGFTYKRPMIITAINVPSVAPDLLERSILIGTTVPRARRDDEEVWSGFDKMRGHILGGILDIMTRAIKLVPEVKLKDPPRMADFARWGTAITMAAGYKRDDFIEALNKNSMEQIGEVVQSNPVGGAIQRFVNSRKRWTGSPSELLRVLTRYMDDDIRGPGWPNNPNHLSRQLNLLTTPLKAFGIDIRTGRSMQGRIIRLRKTK